MKNQLSTVTEVVVRSIFYIITNYVFVSMGLSFHTHWIAILFLLSMVWATIDYGESVNKITGKKVIVEETERHHQQLCHPKLSAQTHRAKASRWIVPEDNR